MEDSQVQHTNVNHFVLVLLALDNHLNLLLDITRSNVSVVHKGEFEWFIPSPFGNNKAIKYCELTTTGTQGDTAHLLLADFL